MLFVAMVLLASLSIPVAAGEPVMTAELADHEVHNSLMESFAVRVNNPHLNDMTITHVSITIEWPGWAPTLYPVFEGRKTLAGGEGFVFHGDAVRMPQTEPGTYSAFIMIVAEVAGTQMEYRFTTWVSITDWGITIGGVPEFLLIPGTFATLMLLITAAFFRLERQAGWPPYRAVPRFHRERRT